MHGPMHEASAKNKSINTARVSALYNLLGGWHLILTENITARPYTLNQLVSINRGRKDCTPRKLTCLIGFMHMTLKKQIMACDPLAELNSYR